MSWGQGDLMPWFAASFGGIVASEAQADAMRRARHVMEAHRAEGLAAYLPYDPANGVPVLLPGARLHSPNCQSCGAPRFPSDNVCSYCLTAS